MKTGSVINRITFRSEVKPLIEAWLKQHPIGDYTLEYVPLFKVEKEERPIVEKVRWLKKIKQRKQVK